MNTIKFTKMHGLGNDFMVIDAIHQAIELTPNTIRQLSHRKTGIGFDQCLLIEKSKHADIDFFYRIFNADGQEVGQCGNGARCLARFIQYYGLSNKTRLVVATATTQMELQINPDDTVTIQLPKPLFEPKKIPLLADTQKSIYCIPLNGQDYNIHAVNVGNPHAVLIRETIQNIEVDHIGKQLSQHPLFPEQINVGFMQIDNPGQIQLRVYERGCGETLACGSGAVAAAAIGQCFYALEPLVKVILPGGNLWVHWPQKEGPIFLTGPAQFVYEGSLIQSN